MEQQHDDWWKVIDRWTAIGASFGAVATLAMTTSPVHSAFAAVLFAALAGAAVGAVIAWRRRLRRTRRWPHRVTSPR